MLSKAQGKEKKLKLKQEMFVLDETSAGSSLITRTTLHILRVILLLFLRFAFDLRI